MSSDHSDTNSSYGDIYQFIDAAGKGDENTVLSLLLTSKVNINDTDVYGFTALMNAVAYNHKEVVSLLIDKGADINMNNKYDGDTAFIYAVNNGYENIVSLLLDKGADINIKDRVSIIAVR